MVARPLTTATPISCRRMSSHCMAALLRNWQRWFSSRRLAFSSSNLDPGASGVGGGRRSTEVPMVKQRSDPLKPPAPHLAQLPLARMVPSPVTVSEKWE